MNRSSTECSETQVLPLAPQGSPTLSRSGTAHRSMTMAGADDVSMMSSNKSSHQSLDNLTVSSNDTEVSTLVMDQIFDMKLDDGTEGSISTKSCLSMALLSTLTSPSCSKASTRKKLLPPSHETRSRAYTGESSITGYFTDKSTEKGGDTWSQAAANIEAADLDQGQETLENEAMGWSYSMDEDDRKVSANEVLKNATATEYATTIPTTFVVVAAGSPEAPSVPPARPFEQERSISPLPSNDTPWEQEKRASKAATKVSDLISHWNNNSNTTASSDPPPRFSPSEDDRIYITYSEIKDEDVLCGREERGTPHPGNANYRSIVANKRSSYQALESNERKRKTAMSTQIMEEEVKGRFLAKQEGGELYYLLTREEARKKDAQSLREK